MPHKADWAHIFFNVLPPLDALTTGDPARVATALRGAAARVLSRHAVALRTAAVAEWEVRLRVGNSSGAWRVRATMPTGMLVYNIWHATKTCGVDACVFHSSTHNCTGCALCICTGGDMHCAWCTFSTSDASSSWGNRLTIITHRCAPLLSSTYTGHEVGEEHVVVLREAWQDGQRVCVPALPSNDGPPVPVMQRYAQLETLQQKRLAARRHKTSYCYDFPAVFAAALRSIWEGYSKATGVVQPSGE